MTEDENVVNLSKTRMTEQMSLRFTDLQRAYVRDQLKRLQQCPETSGVKWSEADVIRAMVERNRRQGVDLTEGL